MLNIWTAEDFQYFLKVRRVAGACSTVPAIDIHHFASFYVISLTFLLHMSLNLESTHTYGNYFGLGASENRLLYE